MIMELTDGITALSACHIILYCHFGLNYRLKFASFSFKDSSISLSKEG